MIRLFLIWLLEEKAMSFRCSAITHMRLRTRAAADGGHVWKRRAMLLMIGILITRITPTGAEPDKLLNIEETPASATLETGLSVQFSALGHYSDGSTVDITNHAKWTSSNPNRCLSTRGQVALPAGREPARLHDNARNPWLPQCRKERTPCDGQQV